MSARSQINSRLLFRLAVTALAALLLLLSLAYWWHGNLVHEVVGTAMFVLLIGHNVINRWWYGTILRAQPDRRRRILLVANLALFLPMSLLLVTSVLISQTLFAFLPVSVPFTVRELHVLAAYWAVIIVAVHLGMHWSVVMRFTAQASGLAPASRWRTIVLRTVTMAICGWGTHSLVMMGMGPKLLNQYTMEMWDFQQHGLQFLLNFASIIGLFASLSHYALQLSLPRTRRAVAS